ncbi:hypothetical protein CEXT_377671 [Caerostris extrusa]|uniref:Uncharacterized protein n=1 Tax=Caerostris extrusa TaxID=172846 RepID=A0AAV4S634_CAEEX|nr:hypothetical protein CEXT_377671 [Caerostris extrusa]
MVLCITICDTAYIVTEKRAWCCHPFSAKTGKKRKLPLQVCKDSVTAARVSVMDSVTATQARLLVWAPEMAD